MKDKPIILCDIDGCVLSWPSKLPEFFVKKGLDPAPAIRAYAWGEFLSPVQLTGLPKKQAFELLEEYNSSKYIKYLTPFSDAIQVVNLLKHEYNFIAVTALGRSEECVKYRKENLDFWFPGAFTEVLAVGIEESKKEYLQQFQPTFFIDDSPEHIYDAKELGHIAIRLVRDTRLDLINSIRCNNFHEIGTIIETNKWILKRGTQ